MRDASQDTDTLLAILSSILPSPAPPHHVLLDALVQANGDVHAAECALTSHPSKINSKKRKGLDGWLENSPPPKNKPRASSSSPVKQPFLKPPSASSSHKPPSSSDPPSKPVANLMDVLKPPSSKSPSVTRLPPLTLANPSIIAQHVPCTLHPSILPPELACNLFHTMLDEARRWKRNKWHLFNRLVESPHRTAFYTRAEGNDDEDIEALHKVARSWYNGSAQGSPPRPFPAVLEEACTIIEKVVNKEMHKRNRFPLEWGGMAAKDDNDKIIWRANFAASNCYEGAKETVGFHSDRLTSLGPYATIASLSLGTPRTFRLREVIPVDEIDKRAARTYNIPLPHNSLIIMHASTQERFKHSIPPQSTLDRFHPAYPPPESLPSLSLDPSNCRINITFRFYRPDFHPDSIPVCRCGERTTLRPDMRKRQREDGNLGTGEKRGEGEFRYWWACTAGEQNEGKTCGFWKVMDVRAEGRGPFAKDLEV